MKKIPTVYQRTPNRRGVVDVVTPGCEWVFAGEGIATRKYDGTCVFLTGARDYARREVKPGKEPPAGWLEISIDPVTGKRMGWEPIEQSPWYAQYLAAMLEPGDYPPGTYELCGPKINGNPEGLPGHRLLSHARAERIPELDKPGTDDEVRAAVLALPWEGVVWHHPDGRMAKLKRRDFTG